MRHRWDTWRPAWLTAGCIAAALVGVAADGGARDAGARVLVAVAADGGQAVEPPRAAGRRPQHRRAGRTAALGAAASWLDVAGGPTKPPAPAGCLEDAQPFLVDHVLHYRVGHLGASMVSADDVYTISDNEDCSGEGLGIKVSIVQYPNKTDIRGSWASLQMASVLPPGVHYVCRHEQKELLPQCLAKIDHYVATYKPSYWLAKLFSSLLSESNQQTLGRVTAGQDNKLLDVVQYMLTAAIIFWILSCCLAVVQYCRLPEVEEPETFPGLYVPTIAERVLGHTVWMVTFTTGIVALVTISVRLIFTDIKQWMVDVILMTGGIVGLLGIVLLSRTMHTSQLSSVAMMHGKCVVPRSWFAISDFILVGGVITLIGVISASIAYVQNIPQELAGCASGALGIANVLRNLLYEREKQKEGTNEVSLVQLTDVLCGSRDLAAGEIDLMKHLRTSTGVTISTAEFYAACRRGEDPLAGESRGEEVPARAGTFMLSDLLWHGGYVYQKSGSPAALLNLPITLGIFVYLLANFSGLFLHYRTLSPQLEALTPAAGVLVPDFSPDVKEYMYLHDAFQTKFSFFASGDGDIVRKQEFSVAGQSVKNLTRAADLVDISTALAQYPVDLHVKLFGGLTAGRQSEYHIAFTEVELPVLTLKITSHEDGWSRCVFLGLRRDRVVAVPRGISDFTMEFLVVPFTVDVPRMMDQWHVQSRGSAKGLATYFTPHANASSSVCEALCLAQLECEFAQPTALGCLFGLWPGGAKSCSEAHQTGVEETPGSPLEKLRQQRIVVGKLCHEERLSRLVTGGQSRCTEVVEQAETGHLTFHNETMDAKFFRHHKRLELWLKDTDAHQLEYATSVELEMARGAPRPRHMFVAAPKGMRFATLRTTGIFTVQFEPFDMVTTPNEFHIVIALIGEDSAFDMAFEGNVAKELSGEDPNDFDLRDCRLPEFRHLSWCGGTDTKLFALKVYKFKPHATSVRVSITPRAEEARAIESSSLLIQVDTIGNDNPADWAANQACALDFSSVLVLSLESLLPWTALRIGLQRCKSFRVTYKESGDLIHAVFDLPKLLKFAVRLPGAKNNEVHLVQALLDNPAVARGDFGRPQQHEGRLAITWEQLGLSVDRQGITIGYEGLNDGATCSLVPSLPHSTDEVTVRWALAIEALQGDVVKLFNTLGVPQGTVAPGALADAIALLPEPLLQELLPWFYLDSELEYYTLSLNPYIAAMRVGAYDLLEDMANKREASILDQTGTNGHMRYFLWQHAMKFGCIKCVDIIGRSLKETVAWCKNLTKLDILGGEPTVCIRLKYLDQVRGSVWRSLDIIRSDLGGMSPERSATVAAVIERWIAWAGEADDYVSRVHLSENGFTNLDLQFIGPILTKMTPKLESLHLDNNRIDTCNMTLVESLHFFAWLENLTMLREVDFSGNRLCTVGFRGLMGSVGKRTDMRLFNFANTGLSSTVGGDLAAAPFAKTLKWLDMSRNDLGWRGFVPLCRKMATIERLELKEIGLRGDADAADMENVDLCGPAFENLRILDLAGNELGDVGVRKILPLIQQRSLMSSVDFSRNGISEKGFVNPDGSIERLPKVVRLFMSHNPLGKVLPDLVKALSDVVTELWLADTQLGEEGAAKLAAQIKQGGFSNLERLDLRDNSLPTASLVEVLQELKVAARRLRGLLLGNNKIETQQDFAAVVNQLESTRFLDQLDLSGCFVDPARLASYEKLTKLTFLMLNNCTFGPSRLHGHSFDFLERITGLDTLMMESNDLPQRATNGIMKALTNIGPLMYLMMKGNKIDSAALEELARANKHAFRSIKYVDLGLTECEQRRLHFYYPAWEVNQDKRQMTYTTLMNRLSSR